MARCPGCTEKMPLMAAVCASCGYDFPDEHDDGNSVKHSLSHAVEHGLLMAGAIVSGFSCLLGTLYGFDQLFRGELWSAAFYGPVFATYSAAMTVVFIRVGRLKSPA